MNNGRYLTLLDIARLDLLKQSGLWKRVRAAGWYAVVAGQTITYRRSLTLGQAFVVESRVMGSYDKWSFTEHTFLVDGTVAAHAVVRNRFLRTSGGTVSAEELLSLTGLAPVDRLVPDWVKAWTTSTRVP